MSHLTTQSGDTDARNQRAQKSYSRHASPPPSSSSVAASTGVMGGWSPASTPPWRAGRGNTGEGAAGIDAPRRPLSLPSRRRFLWPPVALRCRRALKRLTKPRARPRQQPSAPLVQLRPPASHAHPAAPHLWQPRAGRQHGLRVLAPNVVPRLRAQRGLQIKVWRVGAGLGARVGQVAAGVQALRDLGGLWGASVCMSGVCVCMYGRVCVVTCVFPLRPACVP